MDGQPLSFFLKPFRRVPTFIARALCFVAGILGLNKRSTCGKSGKFQKSKRGGKARSKFAANLLTLDQTPSDLRF